MDVVEIRLKLLELAATIVGNPMDLLETARSMEKFVMGSEDEAPTEKNDE